jgi:hypothetical protein
LLPRGFWPIYRGFFELGHLTVSKADHVPALTIKRKII